ncbi:hypothetical protein FIBSPDRAFT_1038862 [Athelia psychrophila]|uniref:7TM GPCR serpentine receptor class x (Srx) domain-containing protein n=1 Tax=Athelia psychrophila TaxID=1759441 RepID=A0A166SJS4_9AGAM|nr:hypothetical protein FIBSPDRAFT_1038862 [Fibularhizoctonia sp. CBS 109695]
MNSSDSMLLNPQTPMSYLPPLVAENHMRSTYINFFTIGVLAWDWVMSMPDEYRILSIGRRLYSSKIMYCCSRVFAIASCLCSCIIYVAKVSDCQALGKTLAALIVLARNTNNLLFFSRVRAVYGNSLRVTFFFGLCYVVVFVTSMLVPSTLTATHIGPTEYCIESEVKPWIASLATLCNAVNDTLVFLAISYRIASASIGGGGRRSALRSFFRGDGAPRVIKELLQDGQLCYLATIVTSITHIIVGLTTGYGTLFTIPVVAIQHVMTCRVHRAVILGLIANKQPPNAPFMLTTFTTSVNTSTMDDRLETRKRLELREGQPASLSGAV